MEQMEEEHRPPVHLVKRIEWTFLAGLPLTERRKTTLGWSIAIRHISLQDS